MKRTIIIFLALVLLLGGGYFGFQVFKIELKARVAQILLQYAWHKTIKTGEDQRPWESFDGTPILRLMIPDYEVDQIVLKGTTGQALAFGPAFHEESLLPGKGGTTVLSSHRDSHGIYIKKIQIGDIISLQDRYNQWYAFQVDDFMIIDVTKNSISTLNSEDNLLIITCYPFNAINSGTSLRYVVSASQKLDARTLN